MSKSQAAVAEQLENKQYAQGEKTAFQKLAKAGGFAFLENTIDGVANLNPDRKARKEIYLTDADKKKRQGSAC